MHTTSPHHLGRLLATGVLAAALIAAAGCSSSTDKAKTGGTTTTSADTGTSTSTSTTAAGGGTATTVAPTSPGGGGGTPTTQATTGPGPSITSFTTPDNIDCHNGNMQNFTASWSVANATKVTISIDGPGIYDTYPPTGSTSLPFNCSSPHTFLLTAYGTNGQNSTRSITLQPRNVQTQTTDSQP